MPAVQEPVQEVKKPNTIQLESLIAKAIGNVPNLQAIQVIHLFEDRYRVNVRVTRDDNLTVKVSKIAASFFVKYEEGEITGGDEITPYK